MEVIQQNKFQKQITILESIGNLFFRGLSLYFLLMAFFQAAQDSLQIEWWNKKEITLICIGTAVMVTLLYVRKADVLPIVWKKSYTVFLYVKKLTITAMLAGILFKVYFKEEQLACFWQEFFKGFYHTIPLVNTYYQTEFPVREVVGSENPLIFLRIVAILLGLLFGLGIAFGKKCAWSFLPLLIAFGGGFFLGYAPSMEGILYLLGGFGLLLLNFRKKESEVEKSVGRFAFFALCMAVGISALIYKPVSEKLMVYHESWDDFQTKLEDKALAVINNSDAFLEWFWRVGGREEYARLSNEAPKLSNEEIFTITVEQCPKEAIYVKDFVGVYYDKGVWYPAEETEFEEFAEKQKLALSAQEKQELTTAEQGRYIQEKGFELSTVWGNYVENVKILTKKRTGNLSLQLYGATIPEGADIVGDNGIRMDEKAYEFQRIYQGGAITLSNFYGASYITEYFDYNHLNYDMWENSELINEDGDKGTVLDAYDAYVRETYTQLPTKQLQKIINNWTLANDNLLQECTYSFDLEPVPPGKDIVEYFVLEQKKGYCMHFASAYALMMRMQGVPSRYVGGYLVSPKDFKENEDSTYTAVVTGQRAHAWVEYYDSYYGWSAYETTPAAYYTGMMNLGDGSVANLVHNLELWAESNGIFETEKEQEEVPEDEKEIEKELAEQEEIQKELEQIEDENKKNNKGQNLSPDGTGSVKDNSLAFQQILKNIFQITGIIATAVLVILLRKKLLEEYRRKRFADTDTRKAGQYITKETLRLLELTNICFDEQQKELDFAKEMENALECLKEGEFVEFIEIARSARYGNAQITQGQIKYLNMIYEKLMKYQTEKLNGYQKLWYQYVQIRLK